MNAQFDIQGHRGCRGWMPENTIPAFIKAVELGVTTLELDVAVSADNQVVVSHEPYMSHEICLTPEGNSIPESEELNHNIYKMDADRVQLYDCGSIPSKKFPHQAKMHIGKPLLRDVIDAVESYVSTHQLKPVWYNIEIKCSEASDNLFHPTPDVFSELILQLVLEKNVQSRVIVQSFDVRPIQHLKKVNAPVMLALLVENHISPDKNIEMLGFKPDIYGPYFKLLGKKDIEFLHDDGIKIFPWTVNDPAQMQKLIQMGVDGIITDYPDRLIELMNQSLLRQ